jgi:rhamnosyltransferase
MRVQVIVPTLNAALEWPLFAPALLACVQPEQVLILDSESSDRTVDLARAAGFQVRPVERVKFNHGGTRQAAAAMLENAEILVYLTQDSVLTGPESLSILVAPFEDPRVGAVWGRQLPRPGATAIETHARTFNYPPVSDMRSLASRKRLGIKTVFMSNSFAAYRRSALMCVGGFPNNVIFGEDSVTAARLLLADYSIAYVAEACVYHSHSYSPVQEFKRYFDIGVLHSREHWLLEEFGHAHGEGKRFVFSELRYLLRRAPFQIPSALLRTGMKFVGYRLGKMEAQLTPGIKRQLSMHPRFWAEPILIKRS